MLSNRKRGRLGAAVAGSLVAVLLWFAFALSTVLSSMGIDPVPPARGAAGSLPVHDDQRPTATILLSQAGTEVTDFLAPYAILTASGAFNVYAVAPSADVVPLYGGVGVVPQLTFEQFDAAYPRGANLVVIPNVLDPDNPQLLAWVSRQASQGSVSASICEGARLLARTGLVDGHPATTHFAAFDDLRRSYPKAHWRNDVRYVDDGSIVMSAGVTAAIDTALHLVARFAGDDIAERTAHDLGLVRRRTVESPAPVFSSANLATATVNGFLGWPRLAVRVGLVDGVDELQLAAVLDTYKRSFAADSATTTPGGLPVRSRRGLSFSPMFAAERDNGTIIQLPAATTQPAFDSALRDVARRFGGATAELVAVQLQYPTDGLDLPAAPSPWLRRLAVLLSLLTGGAAVGLVVQRLWRVRARARSARAAGLLRQSTP